MKIRTEINKDVKILAPRTYFSIPLWKELVNVGKDWLSNGKKHYFAPVDDCLGYFKLNES